MATLTHVLQLVGRFIAPLVIFLIKRHSRFVSFHALQALLLQALYLLFVTIFSGLLFVSVFASIALHQPVGQHNSPPPGFFFLFAVVFLGVVGWWVFLLFVAITYGIQASRGEWSSYPLLGRLARKILKIGPRGELLNASTNV